MRMQIVVHSSLGVFRSKIHEVSDVEIDEVNKIKDFIKDGTVKYIEFEDGDSNCFIFPKEVVLNSIIEFKELNY